MSQRTQGGHRVRPAEDVGSSAQREEDGKKQRRRQCTGGDTE